MGAVAITVGILIQVLIPEQPTSELNVRSSESGAEEESDELAARKKPKFWNVIKFFFTKWNMIIFIAFMLLQFVGFNPVEVGSQFLLIRHKFKKEWLTQIDTMYKPFEIIFAIFIGKWLTKFSEIRMILWSFIIKFLDTIAKFYVYIHYREGDPSSTNWTYWLLALNGILVYAPMYDMNFLAILSFNNKIADKRVRATYLSVLNALNNMGRHLAHTITLFLLHWIPYKTLSYMGWVFALAFLLVFLKLFSMIEDLPHEEWCIPDTPESKMPALIEISDSRGR
jgi:PAT family acetyl-CoA transporter-like MFS transporter 1